MMNCSMQLLPVIKEPPLCTNSIIVRDSDNVTILYVDPLTRLTKDFPEEKPCSGEIEADIYKGYMDNKTVFFTQETVLKVIPDEKVNGSIGGLSLLHAFVGFLSLFDYNSNIGKSIYDKEYVESHQKRMFQNRILEKMNAVVTKTFFTGSYKTVSSTVGNVMDSIGGQHIFETMLEPTFKIIVEKFWQLFSLIRAIFDGYCLIVFLKNHDCKCLQTNHPDDQNSFNVTVNNSNDEEQTQDPRGPPPAYQPFHRRGTCGYRSFHRSQYRGRRGHRFGGNAYREGQMYPEISDYESV